MNTSTLTKTSPVASGLISQNNILSSPSEKLMSVNNLTKIPGFATSPTVSPVKLSTVPMISTQPKITPVIIPSSTRVSPVVIPSPARVSPVVMPSPARVSPVIMPSPARVSPVVVPSPARVSPVVMPSPARVSPVVVPSPARVSPVVMPSSARVSPVVVPSPTRVSPVVVPSPARVSPVIVPRPVAVSPIAVTSPARVSPVGVPSLDRVSPVVVPSPARVSPVVVPSPARVSPIAISPVGISMEGARPIIVTPVVQPSPVTVITPPKTPVTPLSSLEFVQPGLVNQNIEKRLAELGYVSVETIKTTKPNGTVEAKYIKAIDKKGNSVYIELNIEANILVQASDLTTIESVSANKIPYSIKTGVFNAAGLMVNGVMFECKDGLCSVNSMPDGKGSKETVFTIVEKNTLRTGSEEDSPIPLPIVKLTDILENPTQTSLIIEESTMRIRNAVYNMYTQDLNSTVESSNIVHKKAIAALELMYMYMTQLVNSISQLERRRKEYDMAVILTENDIIKYDIIVYNIIKRRELMKQLLVDSKALSEYKVTFNTLKENFDIVINDLNSIYKGIDSIVYTK